MTATIPPPTQVITDNSWRVTEPWLRFFRNLGSSLLNINGLEVLTGDLTLYVRSDGNDANDGRGDNATGAFLTHARALEESAKINRNGHTLTVQSRLATSSARVDLPPQLGAGESYFQGDTATPSNCHISVVGDHCIAMRGYADWFVRGFKLSTTTGRGFDIFGGGFLEFSHIEFGECVDAHMSAIGGATIRPNAPYSISGSSLNHRWCEEGGSINGPFGGTVTITNTPDFAQGFAGAWVGGFMEEQGVTYSGSATGPRFWVTDNASIYVWSTNSLEFYPGDAPGTIERGGTYLGLVKDIECSLTGTTGRLTALTFNVQPDLNDGTMAHVFDVGASDGGSVEVHTTSSGSSGAFWSTYLNSANPAANDIVGGNLHFGEDSGGVKTEYAGIRAVSVVVTGGSERGALDHYVTVNGTPTKKLRIDSDGLKFNTDTASANALDDYEEGTWVPRLTTDGTDFTSVTYDAITSGQYTKVGNLVHVQGVLRTDAITVGSATGNLMIEDLPFASLGEGTLCVPRSSGWAGEEPSGMTVNTGQTSAYLWYRTAADGNSAISVVADAGTGADANLIYFGGTYIAA